MSLLSCSDVLLFLVPDTSVTKCVTVKKYFNSSNLPGLIRKGCLTGNNNNNNNVSSTGLRNYCTEIMYQND